MILFPLISLYLSWRLCVVSLRKQAMGAFFLGVELEVEMGRDSLSLTYYTQTIPSCFSKQANIRWCTLASY